MSNADWPNEFPRCWDVFQKGLDRGLHTGMQLYVSVAGEVRLDVAAGESAPGVALSSDDVMLWLSAGKPLTAVAIGQLRDRGELDWDEPVAQTIPEFAAHGKQSVTLRHLLNHTAGIRHVETGWPDVDWPETIRRICDAPLEDDWVPGQRAGYHTSSSWFLLGEIVARKTGTAWQQAIRERVLEPIGIQHAVAAIASGTDTALVPVYQREGGTLQPQNWNEPPRSTRPSPGSSWRGPTRELGRFYEAMNTAWHRGVEGWLSHKTARQMTARDRADMYDETFLHRVDFGLGFVIDSKQHGVETVPYGYGRYASDETFGHGGAQSAMGMCDPARELVIAFVFNGRPGEPQHNRRSRSLIEAVYGELG